MSKPESKTDAKPEYQTGYDEPKHITGHPVEATFVPKVYQAICNVMEALSKAGISKERKNQSQNYAFRGIDDVYNALCAILSENKLCMLPRVVTRTCEERTSGKGTVLFYVNVIVEFDLVSAEDGTVHTIRAVGEAMDSGDKATNKSQSAAYKYAAMMAFCIPTEGNGKDSEEDTHENIAPRAAPKATKAAKTVEEAVSPPHNPKTGEVLPPHAIAVPVVNDVGDPKMWAKIYIAALKTAATDDELQKWVKLNAKLMGQLPNYEPAAHKEITKVLEELRAGFEKLPVEEKTNPLQAG